MLMNHVGIILAFVLILIFAAKGVHLGLALSLGTIAAAIFQPLTIGGFFHVILAEIFNANTLQLIVAICLISGLGRVMKESGDLDLVVDSLAAIFRSDRLLCMLIPALFGTLLVPGGAIMSAPLVEQSAVQLKLSNARLSALNLFFRHIPNSIYPLYPSIILTSELLGLDRLAILKNTMFVMAVGSTTAYFLFFRGAEAQRAADKPRERRLGPSIRSLCLGFSPVLIMLITLVVFDLPFYLAAALGVAVALARGLAPENRVRGWFQQLLRFFREWVDYKVVLLMVGIMAFKGIVAYSGVITSTLHTVLQNGVALPLIILGMSVTIAFAVGMHQAATGILVPVFASLFPVGAIGPYASLLYFSVLFGYLVSPLHLCLTISNHYFRVSLWEVYQELFWPLFSVLVTALLWFLVGTYIF